MRELTAIELREKERLSKIFKILELCSLSYKQEELVLSFQDQFRKNGTLSPRQTSILEDIYERANN
jgi:hypothetical protein